MIYGNEPQLIKPFDLSKTWHEFMHYMYLPIFIREANPWGTQLPVRLKFARPLISAAKALEYEIGNEWDYIYVTARKGFATPGNPLNRPGWHSDGFGTEDINYVWTDRYPTNFAVQDFHDISDDHKLSAEQFEEQVDPYKVVTYDDNWLMRLDPSVIHAAPEIPAPGGVRSFFKISFSNSKYNLLGNSHNYHIDYDWQMYSRDEVRNDPAYAETDSVKD